MYKEIRDAGAKNEKDFESKRVLHTQPSLALKEYAGVYHDELFGDAWIRSSGDSLILSFPNNINAGLRHWHFDTFKASFDYEWMGNEWLTFRFNAEGKVSGFSFMGIDYNRKE
jgi:hypothetical protein